MSDFIREVDEDYRRDRLMAVLSRYQVPLALLVVAVIAGAGGYRVWADRQVAAAEKVNDRFMAAADLASAGKRAEAAQAFAALATDAPAGYAMLARLRAADALAARDPETAAKAYDGVAEDQSVPASLRDAARLRGAFLRVDREDPKAFEQRYGRFATPGQGFAPSFAELLTLAALKRGDSAAADRFLAAIAIDPAAPAALRGRAQALRALVDAGPATTLTAPPPPASVKILGQAAPAAPVAPAATPMLTPPPPLPAAPPAAAGAPTPSAAKPTAPVPPALKPPGNAPPD